MMNGEPVNLIDPTAMLDRTPRKVIFNPGTRTLRFLSLEKQAGEVVLDFLP